MFSLSPLSSTTLSFSLSLYQYLHLLHDLSVLSIYNNHDIFKQSYLSLSISIYIGRQPPIGYSHISFLALLLFVDMLRTTCFYFFVIVFVILSRTYLCESRRLGPMEKKLNLNRDHLIAKNNEEIKKLEAPSTNDTKTLSSKEPIEHAVGDHGEINEKNTKDDCSVNQASLVKKSASSKRVSRTWKVPKYSKKLPRSDQEHPGFNLDYMQPTTHPPHHN